MQPLRCIYFSAPPVCPEAEGSLTFPFVQGARARQLSRFLTRVFERGEIRV